MGSMTYITGFAEKNGVVWFMVFNATVNNISVISWQSVLLVEKITDLSQVTDKLDHIMLHRVHITLVVFELTALVVIGTDCTCSCKSNYHTLTTTTALKVICLPIFEEICRLFWFWQRFIWNSLQWNNRYKLNKILLGWSLH